MLAGLYITFSIIYRTIHSEPLSKLPEGGYGGCVDMDTFASNFYICKRFREAITARGRPFPSAIRIASCVIIMWNYLKGMTDVFFKMPKGCEAHIQEPAPICIYLDKIDYDHGLECACTCSTRSNREKN